jgi:hypothetical protein
MDKPACFPCTGENWDSKCELPPYHPGIYSWMVWAPELMKLIVLVFLTALVAACAPVTTPTSSLIVATTVVPSTPTALPATATLLTNEVETDADQDNPDIMETNSMNIKIGDTVFTATLVKNSSVDALKKTLSKGPITINMRDYGSMEKVGSLGMDLPRNDEQITTEAGDIILYQGNAFVIYYAPNSWNFTRLGKINNVSTKELKEILGDGNVTVTLSLPQE